MNYVDPSQGYQQEPEDSSRTKKAAIIGSIVVVVIGLVVSGILIYRAKALTDADKPATTTTSPVVADGNGSLGTSSPPATAPPVQKSPCGDGICLEGEDFCKIDCGSVEERFLGSIKAVDATARSITIAWKTDTPSTGTVSYGSTDRYELGSLSSDTPAESHEVELTGLSPGKNYFVRVEVTEEGGDTRTVDNLVFETPAESL